MTDPRDIQIQHYGYSLPDERIARFPEKNRDESKLLVYKKGELSQSVFYKLAGELPENSTLVFNNTKVVPARLFFTNRRGGKIEVFCLSPHDRADITTAMSTRGKAEWKCMVGGAKKWKEDRLTLQTRSGVKLEVAKLGRQGAEYIISFSWEPADLTFSEVLSDAGNIPLPPYMKRAAEQSDKNRYQTVYAKIEGSVAAPTAGLHFTPRVFSALTEKNIQKNELTLHVSAGTFRPVKADKMNEHKMHSEWFSVERETLCALRERKKRGIIPVGTTSMRTLESLHLCGVQLEKRGIERLREFEVTQWEGADNNSALTLEQSLTYLIDYMDLHNLRTLTGKTELIIAPGVKINACDGLITNFHQPESTLLLLVAALIGDEFKRAYEFALENDFRFLSYGDSCLFLP